MFYTCGKQGAHSVFPKAQWNESLERLRLRQESNAKMVLRNSLGTCIVDLIYSMYKVGMLILNRRVIVGFLNEFLLLLGSMKSLRNTPL